MGQVVQNCLVRVPVKPVDTPHKGAHLRRCHLPLLRENSGDSPANAMQASFQVNNGRSKEGMHVASRLYSSQAHLMLAARYFAGIPRKPN